MAFITDSQLEAVTGGSLKDLINAQEKAANRQAEAAGSSWSHANHSSVSNMLSVFARILQLQSSFRFH